VARVLVVEDDVDLQLAYALLLEERGHTVYVQATALGGITEIDRVQPDFMILDLDLRGTIPGEAVAHHYTKNADKPFAVITAYDLDRVRPRVARNPFGSAIWYQKPTSFTELASLVHAIDGIVSTPMKEHE
jgi:DNA-binding response OmpR family regulator